MIKEKFRVGDNIFFLLGVLVISLTWAVTAWLYPELPGQIPTHFDWHGHPDAYGPGTWGAIFLPAILQIVIGLLLVAAYRWPRLANIPGPQGLSQMPEPYQSRTIWVVRHMVVMLFVLECLLLAYLNILVLASSLAITLPATSLIMTGLLGLLVVLIVVYGVWIHYLSLQSLRPHA